MASLVVLMYGLVTPPFHFEVHGPRNAIPILCWGVVLSVVFWWVALFRNPRFPLGGRSVPVSMLVLLPLAYFVGEYSQYLKSELKDGILAETPSPGAESVPVRLQDDVVDARVPPTTTEALTRGRKVVLTSRNSIFFLAKRYWLLLCKKEPDCT